MIVWSVDMKWMKLLKHRVQSRDVDSQGFCYCGVAECSHIRITGIDPSLLSPLVFEAF